MEPEPRKLPVRYYEIDALRFLAALSVVLFHYTYQPNLAGNFSPLSFPELGRVTRYGYLGVELFFIISGYVVLLSAQGKTVRQFFLSRVTRLYPAFWVACTLTFLVLYFWGAGTSAIPMPSGLLVTVKRYVYNMTMLHEFLGAWPIDGPYWSLTVEITFYFLVSLLISYRLLPYLEWVLAGWLAYTALVGFPAWNATPFVGLLFPRYAPFFVAGMLFYLVQLPAGRTWPRYALLLLAYGLALRQTFHRAQEQTAVFHDTIAPGVCLVLVSGFFLLMAGVAFRKINLARLPWLASLGALTYPLYLLHANIGFIIFYYAKPLLNKYVLAGGTLLAMLAAAYLIHKLIEKPLSKLLRLRISQVLDALATKSPAALPQPELQRTS